MNVWRKRFRACRRNVNKLRKRIKRKDAHISLLRKELYEARTKMSLFNGRYKSPRKTDGTINSGGKVYFYETGTSTLKSVYSDENLTTAHANPVILDSKGTALIFLGAGSYDYKVDDSDDAAVVTLQGPVTGDKIQNLINTAISWTVDGVGGTATTFATLTAAMAQARNFTITPSGSLTINISAGTYTNDSPDFSHPQGRYISIIGASRASVIFDNTSVADYVWKLQDGDEIGEISGLTLDQSSATLQVDGLIVENRSSIYDLNDVEITYTGSGTYRTGLIVDGNSYLNCSDLDINGWYSGVHVNKNSTFNAPEVGATTILVDSFFYDGITFSYGSVGYIYRATVSNSANNGIGCYYGAQCFTENVITFDTIGVAFIADGSGLITVTSAPSFTSVTTQYSPAKNTVKDVSGGGSDDTSLIIAP